jgi:DNA-binding IclR family transcriptional regulator
MRAVIQASHLDPDAAPTSSGSVDNALRILLMLESRRTVGVAQVARELGIAKSTAHRLLTTLEHHQYLRRADDSRAYSLGPALLQVGLQQSNSFDLRETARPHLELLRDQTGESCGLVTLEGAEALMVDFVAASHPLRVVERIGDRAPAHLTAGGKVLLADLDPAELNALYPVAELVTGTASSISTLPELATTLESVRRQGIATNLEESGPGIVGIAAPVLGPHERVVAAVVLALPASRLGQDLVDTFGAAVRSAAAAISKVAH